MKHTVRRAAALTIALTSTFVLALSPESVAKKDKKSGKSTGPDSVVVFIGNRMFPDFGDIVTARMKQRHPVGDSEFSFEVVKFYPHFSIIDSTGMPASWLNDPFMPFVPWHCMQFDARSRPVGTTLIASTCNALLTDPYTVITTASATPIVNPDRCRCTNRGTRTSLMTTPRLVPGMR